MEYHRDYFTEKSQFSSHGSFEQNKSQYEEDVGCKFGILNSKSLKNCWINNKKRNLFDEGANPELKYFQAHYVCHLNNRYGKKTKGKNLRFHEIFTDCPAEFKIILSADKQCTVIQSIKLEHDHTERRKNRDEQSDAGQNDSEQIGGSDVVDSSKEQNRDEVNEQQNRTEQDNQTVGENDNKGDYSDQPSLGLNIESLPKNIFADDDDDSPMTNSNFEDRLETDGTSDVDLKQIKYPLPTKIRGKPSQALETTPGGRREKKGPRKFIEETSEGKVKKMLSWLFPQERADIYLATKKQVDVDEIEFDLIHLHDAFLESNVNIQLLKPYFTAPAFSVLQNAVKMKKKNDKGSCALCDAVEDEKVRRWVLCDSCYLWYHFECVKITRKPRNNWFCAVCKEKANVKK